MYLKKSKEEPIENILWNQITNIISTNKIIELAKNTQFFQRKSNKITPEIFFALNVFSDKNICKDSLSDLCNYLSSKENTYIKPQSLNERFNPNAVNFLKEVFIELLAKISKSKSFFSCKFNRIMLTDSTGFQLPDEYAETFKGFSGSATKSAIKLQLTNDLLTGNILSIEVSEGTKSDAKYLPELEKQQQTNDLHIKDLGYFSLAHFEKLDLENTFYLSRLQLSTSVYQKNPNPKLLKNGKLKKDTEYIKLDLVEISKELSENEIKELEVYVGKKIKIKTRLIINKLSESLVEKKRVTQAKKENKKGIKVSQRTKELTTVNIYITNIESEILSKEIIYLLYSLRWQIELTFKIWKSIYQINKVKRVKIERFLCHLYGSLITILLSTLIVSNAREIIATIYNKEISEYKAFKTVKDFLIDIGKAILKPILTLENILKKIINTILKTGIKSVKKGKKSVFEILELIEKKIRTKEVDAA